MDNNIKKIVELKIEEDDIIFDTLGLEVVSLVEQPAIEVDWKAFSKIDEIELTDIEYEGCSFSIEEQKITLQKAGEVGETIGPDDIYLELKEEKFSLIKDILKGLSVIDSLTTNQAANDEGETYYRYSGPMAQRNFCKTIQRLNRIYKKADIEEMEVRGVNKDFGHQGQPYSIWEYSGGLFCKHTWNELKVFKGTNDQKVIIDLGPVRSAPADRVKKGVHPGNPLYNKLQKQQFSINDEKRIVIGPLLIPNKMILREDENGNPYYVYFSRETIKKIAEKFFRENKQNNTDINHDEIITKENTLLESWIVEDTIHDKSFMYGFRSVKGTWMASYKINDDETWKQIKEGKLNGFSVAGFFIEKSKKEKEAELTLQKIIEMINEIEDENE